MFPMQGLGSNGLGIGAGGGMMDPRLMALLQGGGGGMGGGGAPQTPMSMINIPQRPMMGGGGPMMAPAAPQNAQPQPWAAQGGAGGGGGLAAMLGDPAKLKALLDMLKGSQTGLPAQGQPGASGVPGGGSPLGAPVAPDMPGAVPGAGGAMGAPGGGIDLMALLRAMGSYGGMPMAGGGGYGG